MDDGEGVQGDEVGYQPSPMNHQPAFPHERLAVWQQAKSLAKDIYTLTAEYPREERFGLVNQMRRAAVSIMSNLAEGSGRTSPRDQAHFSQLAFGSLLELDAQLQLSVDLNFMPATDYPAIRATILGLVKRISNLRSAQLKRGGAAR